MAIPAGWRSNREPLGAFSVLIRDTAVTTDWVEVDVRAGVFLTRADVVAQLDANGLTSTGASDTAVLRSVAVQCTDAANAAQVSVNATPGGAAAPTPADAFSVAMANGGAASREFHTRMEQTTFQYRAAAATTDVNIEVRFDVPVAS